MAQKKLTTRSSGSVLAARNQVFAKNPVSKDFRTVHLQAGDLCPKCKVERLDYDGLLNLSCPRCGAVEGAWGGCS